MGISISPRPLDYGYNVLRKRLAEALPLEIDLYQKTVLEIAPGDNFSGPIAAVLLGAKKGIGIDAYDYTDLSKNQQILDFLQNEVTLSEQRLKEIKDGLRALDANRKTALFQYSAPWRPNDISAGSIDLATSLSTLEHVQSPEQLYNDLFGWLTNGGVLINKIDLLFAWFKSLTQKLFKHNNIFPTCV